MALAAIVATLAVLVPALVIPVVVPFVKHRFGYDLPVQVVLAIDVSASMRCPVDASILQEKCPRKDGSIPRFDGRSRIRAAVDDGVVPALAYLRDGDQGGIWTFATVVTPGTITPFGSLKELKRKLTPLVRQTGSGTRLYETIFEAVQRLQRDWKPRTINAVIILTDGRDNGSKLNGEPLTEQLLDETLGPKDPDKPVYVFLTAAYDAPKCRFLFRDVDAFEHKCLDVDNDTDVQDAYDKIQQRLDALARRSTAPD